MLQSGKGLPKSRPIPMWKAGLGSETLRYLVEIFKETVKGMACFLFAVYITVKCQRK